ncbi:unnamed protein product [Moneuplotes crassus]|uniref:Uncharacterized protein n=1 Tax=Euplotes crassus TaxID=5936 RepID=A0AAD1XQD0_EUPCR|nr:unnamed protein product [Moneuplotes crassus]
MKPVKIFTGSRVRFSFRSSTKSNSQTPRSTSNESDEKAENPQSISGKMTKNFSQPLFLPGKNSRTTKNLAKHSIGLKSIKFQPKGISKKTLFKRRILAQPKPKTISLMERCKNEEFKKMLLRYAPEIRNLINQQHSDLPVIPDFVKQKKFKKRQITRSSYLRTTFTESDEDFRKIREICLLGGRLNQPPPKIFTFCVQKSTERLNRVLKIQPMSTKNTCCKTLISNTTSQYKAAISHFQSRPLQILIKNRRHSLT